MASPEFVRVKEKETGYHRTYLRAQFDPQTMTELKGPAIDEHGAPLAPDFTKSPSNQSGQKANTERGES